MNTAEGVSLAAGLMGSDHAATAVEAAPVLLVAAAILLVLAIAVLPWVWSRPQRGLLLLAAFVPFDGLLVLVDVPGIVNGWKEALILGTALFAILTPRHPPPQGRTLPLWAYAAGALAVLGLGSAAMVGGIQGALGFKIGFLYMLIPLILWRHPFSARDRDQLVSILMATGLITAVVGIAQQVIGIHGLHALGYEYNTTLRTAGGFLRSFSTFVQPFPFAFYMMAVLLIGGAVALGDPRRTRNLLFLLCTPILALGMATSIVRASYLGLALGVLILAWLHQRWLLLIPALAAGLLALLPIEVFATAFSSSSLNERTDGWQAIPSLVLDAPWGAGLGVTGAAAEKLSEVTGADYAGYQPDNMYAKTLIELGIIGLWLLLIVFLAGMLHAFRTWLFASGDDSSLAVGILAHMAAVVTASYFATYLEIFPMDVLFWLLLGVLTCIPRNDSSGSTPSPIDRVGAASRHTSVS